jgi:hypothetical protein
VETVVDAITRTVAYVDVFDYPLTAEEIHRYLIGVAVPAPIVYHLLTTDATISSSLTERDGYFALAGREQIIELRQKRRRIAMRLWPHAIRYGQRIGALPFVRMVAVTGSLAVDNVVPDADIDYLVVTEPGRLWLCRAFTILIVKRAARQGVPLCPNYFLSTNALKFADRNLYTAHELVQMVPIFGLDIYERMLALNDWTVEYLPNAHANPAEEPSTTLSTPRRLLRAAAETTLRTPPGGWLERWEMKRKIIRFSEEADDDVEAAFCPDWCKGHFDGHGHRIMHAFEDRISDLHNVAAE